MFKPRKKILGYLLIAFIFFSSGCFIGVVYSNGSNPIWDEILGISNILWLNTTQGVNSPEYYRNDENFTAWVESIGGGVTDHGDLTGLGDDDHSLYLLQDGSEGLTGDWDIGDYNLTGEYLWADEFYKTGIGNYTEWIEGLEGGGVTDHGDLTGLGDDDHSLYLLQDGSEELTGDWDTGSYGITTADIDTLEYNLNSVNVTDILAYPELPLSYTISQLGSTYYAKNGSTGQIDYSGTNGSDVFNNVLTAMPDGGRIHFGLGHFDMEYDIIIQEKNWYIITGEGTSSSGGSMHDPVYGGTVIHFNSARFRDVTATIGNFKVRLEKIGLLFTGSYTEPAIYLPDTFLLMDSVYIKADCSLQNGNGTQRFMQVGSPGPVGAVYIWRNIRFYDSRNAGNESKLLYLHTEYCVWDGVTLTADIHVALNETATLFWFGTVSWMTINDFDVFTNGGFDSNNICYKYMFYYGAGTSNLICDGVQLLEDDDIFTAHFQSGNTGYLFVDVRNHFIKAEGGFWPTNINVTTSGTGRIYFTSRWYIPPDNKGWTLIEGDYSYNGSNIAEMQVVMLQSDGLWDPADASTESEGGSLLAICTKPQISPTWEKPNSIRLMLRGWYRDDTWSWTVGSKLYLSTTSGAITDNPPSASNEIQRAIGYAVAPTIAFFSPSMEYTVNP